MGKTMDKPKTIDLLTFGGEDVKCVRLSDYEELERQLAECQRERDMLRKFHHDQQELHERNEANAQTK